MANFPGPGSIILRGRGKSRIDPGSEDGQICNPGEKRFETTPL